MPNLDYYNTARMHQMVMYSMRMKFLGQVETFRIVHENPTYEGFLLMPFYEILGG